MSACFFRAQLSAVLGFLMMLACGVTQAQTWQTAVAIGQDPVTFSTVDAVATDAVGDVYLGGSFRGFSRFDGILLTATGGTDVFLAKWSRTAQRFVWAQRLGGAGLDKLSTLVVDGSTLVVTGTFTGASMDVSGTTLTNLNAASEDIFLARYSTSGALSWALRLGGTGPDNVGNKALVLRGGNIYLAGSFALSAIFGSTTLTTYSDYDMFVAKLTDGGAVVWAQRGGGFADDGAVGLALSDSAVYVHGYTDNVGGNFGGVVASGTGKMFLAKLIDSGPRARFVWAMRMGGGASITSTGLAANGRTLYLVGFYTVAGAAFGAVTLPVPQDRDAFVLKFADTGTTAAAVWAQCGTGTRQETITAVAVSGAAVYVTGWADSPTASFGSLSVPLNGALGASNALVLQLADLGPTGQFVWVEPSYGPDTEVANALTLQAGGLCIGGWANGPCHFGYSGLNINYPTMTGYFAVMTVPTLPTRGAAALALGVYPNPARGEMRVRVPAGAQALTITDATGRVRRTCTLATGTVETAVSLRGLPSGVYVVQAGTATGRLVVEE